MENLVLGIDLCNDVSHISFYDFSRDLPETVPFAGNATVFKNPKTLDEIFSYENPLECTKELMKLLASLIGTARKHCNCRDVRKLCITTAWFYKKNLDAIKRACIALDGDMENISIISHEECLAHYAFGMHRDLWCNGVVLLDYSDKGLMARRLEQLKIKRQDVIAQTARKDDDCEKLLEAIKISDRTQGLQAIEDVLLEAAREVILDKATSSVYLTGDGFDTTILPNKFLQYICNRHRVFAGQNLYVKGACIAAFKAFKNVEETVMLACQNRIPLTIDMDIVERGKNMIFRVAQAGTNWYAACRKMDFIVDDCDKLVLHMHPVGDKADYDEVIDFSDFPYREGKTTRISVEFNFKGDDSLEVVITDKGFGDFVKSSKKVVSKILTL